MGVLVGFVGAARFGRGGLKRGFWRFFFPHAEGRGEGIKKSCKS